jgi:pSer/pThr/pTyr-binding forkhead associated (FHA) protein
MSWFIEHLHRDGTVIARVPLQGSRCRIGRALDNDLVLDDAHVAAHHAELIVGEAGTAELVDLGTRNGVARQKGRRATRLDVSDEQPLRIGQSLIRVRNSTWSLAPEMPLQTRWVWPWALLALLAVLGHSAWDVWLRDLGEKSPPYLNLLAGSAIAVAIWSGLYALLGRLISGNERFFSHLLIACCGYLIAVLVDRVLELLAFASGWLWPLQISRFVLILVVALIVRTHLRLADPRHWPTLRWAVGVVAVGAALVPLAQLWISERRFTQIQTLSGLEHPAVRLAKPVTVEQFGAQAQQLKARADAARKREGNTDAAEFEED